MENHAIMLIFRFDDKEMRCHVLSSSHAVTCHCTLAQWRLNLFRSKFDAKFACFVKYANSNPKSVRLLWGLFGNSSRKMYVNPPNSKKVKIFAFTFLLSVGD